MYDIIKQTTITLNRNHEGWRVGRVFEATLTYPQKPAPRSLQVPQSSGATFLDISSASYPYSQHVRTTPPRTRGRTLHRRRHAPPVAAPPPPRIFLAAPGRSA
ncbi:hypothetical protein V8G54_031015 [Vigna mungo]|uniref:Uncharacterized protein n=1 Tax=Vigna mungo TaxID=3915 RepID=A0AAQ3MY15_VIGMU